MIYSFDMEVAKEYGVDAAILILNFQYWLSKNKANNKNYCDGHYWTYNSKNALQKLFPFWTERQIKYILNNLITKGVLITGNYNKNKYDKTLWYAFADEKKWIKIEDNDNGMEQNVTIDGTILSNQSAQIVQAIPDNKPNNKPNNSNTHIKEYVCIGEFKNVKLTLEQIKKLVNDYEWYFEDAINTLSSYLEFKGDKYKSHYAVLGKTNWVWEKVHKNPDCGIRPIINVIPDPTVQGGLRKETAWEYYSKKYNL